MRNKLVLSKKKKAYLCSSYFSGGSWSSCYSYVSFSYTLTGAVILCFLPKVSNGLKSLETSRCQRQFIHKKQSPPPPPRHHLLLPANRVKISAKYDVNCHKIHGHAATGACVSPSRRPRVHNLAILGMFRDLILHGHFHGGWNMWGCVVGPLRPAPPPHHASSSLFHPLILESRALVHYIFISPCCGTASMYLVTTWKAL